MLNRADAERIARHYRKEAERQHLWGNQAAANYHDNEAAKLEQKLRAMPEVPKLFNRNTQIVLKEAAHVASSDVQAQSCRGALYCN